MAINFDVQIVGDALNDYGFEAFNTIDGVGLNTFGFLWSIEGIWNVCADCSINPTVWTDADCC